MSYNYNPVRTEAIKAAFAPLNGGLFGLSYGTAIRIGYEQIYPALFPNNIAGKQPAPNLPTVMNQLTELYKIFGGMGAHEFGINTGIKNAMNIYENAAITLDKQQTNQAFQIAQMGIGKGGGLDTAGLLDFLKPLGDILRQFTTNQNFNVNQNLADLPPSQNKDFNDPIASEIGEQALQEEFLRRYGDYTWEQLNGLLQSATGDLRVQIMDLMNSPAIQKTIVKKESQKVIWDRETLAWIKKRDSLLQEYNNTKSIITQAQKEQSIGNNPNWQRSQQREASAKNQLFAIKNKLRIMSKDTRAANRAIAAQALALQGLLNQL